MQRVKAHELRAKDEKALVEELTKFRVLSIKFLTQIERARKSESKQGLRCSTSQASKDKSKQYLEN